MDPGKKTATDGDAATLVKSYLEALNRARIRAAAPGGGDPFFENYKIAEQHLADLKSLVGKRQAARLIRAEEEKGVRYVFETPDLAKRRPRSR